MSILSRRSFLATGAVAASATLHLSAAPPAKPSSDDKAAFFLIGDTHFLADKDQPEKLAAASQGVTDRLIDTLNKLPGTDLPADLGGGKVLSPHGLIHAGDVIDSGDKPSPLHLQMQRTEWKAFEESFGLTGSDARLKMPVYEIHGNHDAPQGTGHAIDRIKARNKSRPGLVNLSPNGLHYSWNWGPIHFVNLGIVVGSDPEVKRRRRYAPLDSQSFLVDDLAKHVAGKQRPVIITHHIDVARYSVACDKEAEPGSREWDPCDVAGYHGVLHQHPVLGVLYGHTHVRNIFRWSGEKTPVKEGGIPVFNTDNSAHFNSQTQALLYCEATPKELVVREFATADAWQTGKWTPQIWRMACSVAMP